MTTTISILRTILLCVTIAIAIAIAVAVADNTDDYDSDYASSPLHLLDTAPNGTDLSINSIPASTRAHWMREANLALAALSGPCPFAAFGSVVVNHTIGSGPSADLGQLVCIGANSNSASGNPVMHGEVAAITNCSRVLTDPHGLYRLTAVEALAALADLSIYTNAESCPMCASAIRWGGFREYVYGTSIETLIKKGWGQIRISSLEVFRQSFDLPRVTRAIGDVLVNETDPLFSWQFDPAFPCPKGCVRSDSGAMCVPN